MPRTLLKTENLLVRYHGHDGEVTAVSGVDFSIAEGESLAIVGESGCGKTSVALALMGLFPAKAVDVQGVATLDGRDVLSLPPAKMREVRGQEISMIFQDPMTSLNPYLRIGLQVAEPLIYHRGMRKRAAREAAARLLESVDFTSPMEHLSRYPHEFSGGMCQRAMIASALSCSPKLLIADEPTTALDVITQDRVLRVIQEMRGKQNMALLLITHDLGIVASIADRVAIMHNGGFVEMGTVHEIFSNPQHDYTKALLAAVPRLDGNKSVRLASVQKKEQVLTPAIEGEPTPQHSPTPPKGNALIQVEDLSVHFHLKTPSGESRTIKAVDSVSLEIKHGEVLGLVGQSGSGKSTLVRAILQLIKPTSGRVKYEGRELTALPESAVREVWKELQLIFQDPYGSLNSRMTAGQIISRPLLNYGITPRRKTRERVEELMATVQLDPAWLNRYPHEFSGGQRQRIGIARALACNPRVLFCDEPVSALDVSIQADIINLLQDLTEALSLTLLFISHDLAVVRHIADRVAVMNHGEIVEWLKTDDICAEASHPYTKELLAAIPIPDPTVHRIEVHGAT
jgi:ABC-type glutathione transport system ATPase component